MTCRHPVLLVTLVATMAAAVPAQFTGLSWTIVDHGRVLDGRVTGTVRLYADLQNPLDKLLAWGGDSAFSMSIQTSDPLGFWQHPLGGNLLVGSCALEERWPNLRYDSWLALGFQAPFGSIGIDFTGFNSGGGITTSNGAVFQVPTQATVCPVNGRVLLAQFTVGVAESVSGQAFIAGTLSNGTAPCGTVPNGPPWQVNATFSFTVSAPAPLGALSATPGTISLSAGGTQSLTLATTDPDLQTDPCFAGDPYLLVGTFAGTYPGSPALPSWGGDLMVPLINQDAYTALTLACPTLGLFSGFCGVLGASGQSTASITLPAGSPPSLAGLTADHVAVVWRPTLGIVHVSNPASVGFVP